MRFTWLLLLALPGCAAPLVSQIVSPMGAAASAGATGGTWAMQERGIGGALSDNALALAINDAWLQRDPAIFRKVSTGIVSGRVLLTGTVLYDSTRDAAVESARSVPGVIELIDEIQVRENLDLGTMASDRWINTQLRADLTFASAVSAVNYSLDTVDGMVFILGVARDAEEFERVTAIARGISGVRGVVAHVRLASEETTAAR
jgi:osmotically-inducible protein OsmY